MDVAMIEAAAEQPRRVPVVILTGFLGSGKTTLLNRILTSPRGARVAVIVNEFAEVGIDHHLMLAADQFVFQANNGCICCSVRGDLIAGLFKLMEMRADIDLVIIEMSGMAEPAPVAQTLYVDESIRRAFVLQGVVTMLDAKHLPDQLRETSEASNQIAFADLLFLNKTDLVDAETLDRTEAAVRAINTSASIVRTRAAEIDLDLVFEAAPPQQRVRSGFFCEEVSVGSDGASISATHEGDVETISIVAPGEVDGTAISLWFRDLLSSMGNKIMRMKGVLNFQGDADRFFFQGVHAEFEGRPGPAWDADDRLNRLVFIGRGLDRQRIEAGFRACFATAETGPCAPRPIAFYDEISPLRLDQIRYWLRQNFGFAKDAPIVIKQVPCMKPACPPIETAIVAVLKGEPPRVFKIQRTINEITFDHVYDLMENPMPCC